MSFFFLLIVPFWIQTALTPTPRVSPRMVVRQIDGMPVQVPGNSVRTGPDGTSIQGFKCSLGNEASRSITAVGVTWITTDAAGRHGSSSASEDYYSFFGDLSHACRPGDRIELQASSSALNSPHPFRRVELRIDFIEFSDSNVWPDGKSKAYHRIRELRGGTLGYHSFLQCRLREEGSDRVLELISHEIRPLGPGLESPASR